MSTSVGFAAPRRAMAALGFVLLALALPGISVAPALAQVVLAPENPVVGSSNPVTPEPPVARPATTPCTVTLFSEEAFFNYTGKTIQYAPPSACPGPWAKVVLTIDFSVTEGVQYDRTASLYLGNANIFYGTTAEPNKLGPAWHVERDLTDLSALFKTRQSGKAIIYNIVNSSYTGVIHGTAKLLFYPTSMTVAAPVVPDLVIPVSSVNSPYELDSTGSEVTATVAAPHNVEKAYLDVISQSQHDDEFWYLCVPSAVTSELESCGNTAFRETEITIDGQPAGVAPVYPWIYTGGIDPFLWEPITGIQTLNFKPYRVDLTPFAGVLSDGAKHTLGISVYNANNYFLETANLLLYTDHGSSETGGSLIERTLSAEPTPQVLENLATDASGTTGTVTVASDRTFTIAGYVNTSHGRVNTTVDEKVSFDSTQTFNVASSGIPEIQNVAQSSQVDSTTRTQSGVTLTVDNEHFSYPLSIKYTLLGNADGSYTQLTSVDQQLLHTTSSTTNGMAGVSSNMSEQVQSTDRLFFNSNFNITGNAGAKSSASYFSKDSTGACYSRKLISENLTLTSVENGIGCP